MSQIHNALLRDLEDYRTLQSLDQITVQNVSQHSVHVVPRQSPSYYIDPGKLAKIPSSEASDILELITRGCLMVVDGEIPPAQPEPKSQPKTRVEMLEI